MFRSRLGKFFVGVLLGVLLGGSYLGAACNDPNNVWITRNLGSGVAADDTCWTLFNYNSCGPMWQSDRGHIVRAVCGTPENPNSYYVMFGNQVVYSRWVDYANPNWGWGLPCPLFFMASGSPQFDAIYGSFNSMMSPLNQSPKDCVADDQAPPPPQPQFDTDNDGLYDDVDSDDDGDGVPDNCDMGPRNKNDKRYDCNKDGVEDEPQEGGNPSDPKGDYGDCDGDRIFNKYDEDDDNDGCPDIYDPDRCNADSTCDCDKDGKLDNEDKDDDNDGCPDEEDPDPCDAANRCKSGEAGGCDGEQRLRQIMSTITLDISNYLTGTAISPSTGQAPRMYTFRYPMPNGGFGQIYMDSNFTVEGAALFGVTMNEFRILLRLCVGLMMYAKFTVFVIKSFEVI